MAVDRLMLTVRSACHGRCQSRAVQMRLRVGNPMLGSKRPLSLNQIELVGEVTYFFRAKNAELRIIARAKRKADDLQSNETPAFQCKTDIGVEREGLPLESQDQVPAVSFVQPVQPAYASMRRMMALHAGLLLAIQLLSPSRGDAKSPRSQRLSLSGPRPELRLPLQLRDGVFCLVYSIDGSYFRGVIDTGSPFLTVAPNQCREWGCWRGEGEATLLGDTFERYATQDGNVQWRSGDVSFSQLEEQPRHCISPGGRTVFGLFRSTMSKGGRGDQSLVGLVKSTAPGVRPSLLGQTTYQSFTLDCASGMLVLSTRSLLVPGRITIPLLDMRRWGALAQQYIARVRRLTVNGEVVRTSKPIFAMVDSGSTGLFMTERLFYPLQEEARGWRSCEVELEARGGLVCRLSAGRSSPLFVCLPTRFPWLDDIGKGHLLVLGMAFLEGRSVSVDMDRSLMQISNAA